MKNLLPAQKRHKYVNLFYKYKFKTDTDHMEITSAVNAQPKEKSISIKM